MKKAICWNSGFMRMIVQRHENSIELLHSSLNAARRDEEPAKQFFRARAHLASIPS